MSNQNKNDLTLQYDYRINSGVLLLLNCPKFMEFGIDYSAWTIGDKFMGIKLIPPGPHFVYYSTRDEEYLFKQGFFINVNIKTKIHIRKWNIEVGDFVNLKEEEEKNFSIGVGNLDFDAYLGNYPLDQFANWKDLTFFIDEKILERLEPINKRYITSSKEYENKDNQNEEIKGNIHFTRIPLKKFLLNYKSEPELLTKMNIDKSEMLEELIKKEYNLSPNMLLGEFQYSFITFFLCEIFESFEQWRIFFILICSCKEAIINQESFYCDFVEVIYHMFRQFPKDFFHDQISCDNFLNKILTDFIKTCESSLGANSQLNKRIKMFKKFLNEYFSFEIKDEEQRIIEKYLNKDYKEIDNDDELPAILDDEEIENIMRYREDGNTELTDNTYEHEDDDINMKNY